MHLPATALPGAPGLYVGPSAQAVAAQVFAPRVPRIPAHLLLGSGESLSQYTWTSRPAAGSASGDTIIITDVGPTSSLWYSDGTRWLPTSRVLLARGNTDITAPTNTSDNTLVSVTIPGGTLGTNGGLSITALFTTTDNGNAKTLKTKIGATTLMNYNGANGQSVFIPYWAFRNRNAADSQIGPTTPLAGVSTAQAVTGASDTSANVSFSMTVQKATGTDSVVLKTYAIWIEP